MKMRRRIVATAMTLAAVAATITGVGSPAAATPDNASTTGVVQPLGFFDGDISNWLPSSYTVKIASLSGGSETCHTWNAGTFYSCQTWWLPSGQADDAIRYSNFDTDAFMIETQYRVKEYNGNGALTANVLVAGFTWTKIVDGRNTNCNLVSGAPVCEVR